MASREAKRSVDRAVEDSDRIPLEDQDREGQNQEDPRSRDRLEEARELGSRIIDKSKLAAEKARGAGRKARKAGRKVNSASQTLGQGFVRTAEEIDRTRESFRRTFGQPQSLGAGQGGVSPGADTGLSVGTEIGVGGMLDTGRNRADNPEARSNGLGVDLSAPSTGEGSQSSSPFSIDINSDIGTDAQMDMDLKTGIGFEKKDSGLF
ncbi:MAG: hypothetical protein ABEJ07_06295 [Candidatus Nanohaloarchaea archaeon]